MPDTAGWSRHPPVLTPTSCCAVPFEEDDRDPRIWFLDHSYMESMCAMFKKVNGEHSYCNLLLRP